MQDRGLLYYTQNVPNPDLIQTGEMSVESSPSPRNSHEEMKKKQSQAFLKNKARYFRGAGALMNDIHNFSLDKAHNKNTLEGNNLLMGNKSLIQKDILSIGLSKQLKENLATVRRPILSQRQSYVLNENQIIFNPRDLQRNM